METYKIQKYLSKLSTEPFESDNFKLYLDKINYWYNQYGGKNLSKIQIDPADNIDTQCQTKLTANECTNPMCKFNGSACITDCFSIYRDRQKCFNTPTCKWATKQMIGSKMKLIENISTEKKEGKCVPLIDSGSYIFT